MVTEEHPPKFLVSVCFKWGFLFFRLYSSGFLFLHTINFKFLLWLHQKYYITQYEELGFSYLTQMTDDRTTNSHHHTCKFSPQNVGRMYFLSLGVKVNTKRWSEKWNHREPIQELWTDLFEYGLFKPNFVLSLVGRAIIAHSAIFDNLHIVHIVRQGVVLYGRVRRGGGKGGRGGDDCHIWRNEQRSLVRQEITQTWVWISLIQTNRSTTLVWAPFDGISHGIKNNSWY